MLNVARDAQTGRIEQPNIDNNNKAKQSNKRF